MTGQQDTNEPELRSDGRKFSWWLTDLIAREAEAKKAREAHDGDQ